MGTNAAGYSIGLTASLAERPPLVIELDSEIVTKLSTMDSALAVAVNPNMTGMCFALKFTLSLVLPVILANLCEPLPWKVELDYDARLPRSSNSWGGGGCH